MFLEGGIAMGIGDRVRDAVRLAFFRHVSEARLRGTWLAMLLAVLVTVAIPTLYGLQEHGEAGVFSLRTLPGALFAAVTTLFAAIVVGSMVRRDDAIPRIWLASLLAWIVIDTLTLVLWYLLSELADAELPRAVNTAFFVGPLLWLALATVRFGNSIAEAGRPRRAAAYVLGLALVTLPLAGINPERSLWTKDWTRDRGAAAGNWKSFQAAGDEEVIYRHAEVLARGLDAVTQGRPGIVDVFFVGMAGYGHQDVFMREIDKVAQLMGDRFDAEGHIVKLVNNPKTVREVPIATVTSLRAALKRVAEKMDVQEDVLVLFLTSHGSADHRFSLSLAPLQLRDLDPATLREVLDSSGIRNRVVIVSACYAGGFVEKLKDERTLVIASAAPDRNSFGCSNEAEWTYFGQAYFNEALRKTRSFTRAFDEAVVAIEAREKQGGHDPSRPMLWQGAAIREKLAELERQLMWAEPAAPPKRARTALASAGVP
jgi:hypothetical protein